ncbi:MAG: isopeptide-forming domain-containing fimbrial protein [Rhodoferax sp.]|nr:isopeptide-forming domain-containing fimbrial protein [Rhodoferax sp.]
MTIADTLATGITLSGAPTITGGTSTATLSGCPASGSNTTGCQINSGATVGTIIVRVPVNVAASATNGNNTANLSGGGDPACTAATGQACDPTVPVPVTTPAVSVAKTASPAAGTTVAVGQTITYTLTSTVTNAATTTLSTLTDTLGAGLTFGAIGASPGGYLHNSGLSRDLHLADWHTDRQLQRELHSDRERIGHDQRLQQRGTDRRTDLYNLYRHQPSQSDHHSR